MSDQSRAAEGSDCPGLPGDRAAVGGLELELPAERNVVPFEGGWRGRREERSIRRALAGVPPGSQVLDVACGARRLLEILTSCGYRVTCAESSDVTATPYPDGHFDAVICNRLFHHFRKSEERIRALAELRRICRGVVIVSFFNAFSLGAIPLGLKHALRPRSTAECVSIPAWSFLNDIRRAGLSPASLHAVAWGISPLWHVVSVPTCGRAAGKRRAPARQAEAG